MKNFRHCSKRNVRILAAAAFICIVCLIICPVFANVLESSVDALDYSSGIRYNTEITIDKLIEAVVGTEIDSSEREYLKEEQLAALVYSDFLPADSVSVSYDENEGKLVVLARRYSYTAANGERVEWIPYAVNVNGRTEDLYFENDAYIYKITDAYSDTDTYNISVEYQCVLTLDKASVNYALNYAYNAAYELSRKLEKYNFDIEEYNRQNTLYENYIKELDEYNLKCIEYEDYLEKYKSYEERLESYGEYLKKKNEYDLNKTRYEQYVLELELYKKNKIEYAEYIKQLDTYRAEYARYRDYLSQLSVFEDNLTYMNCIYVKDSKGYNMYSTLMGNTVQEVVDRKQELVNAAGVDPKLIDMAYDSTLVLRTLLTEYKNISTNREKYSFYILHYEEIKENFSDLYFSLHAMYSNNTVLSTLVRRGKAERYRQFVSELYAIATGLDDTVTRDSSWLMGKEEGYDKYPLEHFIEEAHRPPDLNRSTPITDIQWPDEVKQPVEPEKVEQMPEPEPVSRPGSEPVRVAEPVEPDRVEKPEKPLSVNKPVNPDKVEMSRCEKDIVEAYNNGIIKKRQELDEPYKLTLKTFFSKNVGDVYKLSVDFYDSDGKTLIKSIQTDPNRAVSYTGNVPTKEADARYIYEFDCWVDENGNKVDFDEPITSDKRFFASYGTKLQKYEIVWNVGSDRYTEVYEYGQMPEYKGITDMAPTNTVVYEFLGWDHRPVSVVSDAEYTAVYSESVRKYSVTWSLSDRDITARYEYMQTPTFEGNTDRETDERYSYSFSGWDKDIVPVTENVVYSAQYNRRALASENDRVLEVRKTSDKYSVNADGGSINIQNLLSAAQSENFNVEISTDYCTVFLDNENIKELISLNTTDISLEVSKDNYGVGKYKVVFKSGENKELSVKSKLRLTVPVVSGNSILIVDDGIEVVYFDISADISFVDIMVYAGLQSSATQKFNITIPESDNGSCESEQNARAGDTVTLNISPRYGYKLADVQILNESDGSIVNFDLESMSFVMPYSGVRIEVSYEIEAFTVRFMNDGKVISERVYSRGETVDVPDMPKEIIDGEYCYTFKGWSPTVSTVSGDTVYYAEYARTRIGDGAVMHRIDYKDRSYLLYLEIGIAAALFFGGVFLLVRLVLKKVRKHKTKNK